MTGEYPYIVEVTTVSEGAEGPEELILFDPEKTFIFSAVCGGGTFIVPGIRHETIHEIDNTNAVVQIPVYVSYAPEYC